MANPVEARVGDRLTTRTQDLEVLGSSPAHRTVSSDKELYSTLFLFTQVYMLWFNFILGLNSVFFCFELTIIHYHTQKQKKVKFKPRRKLNHYGIYMILNPRLLG